MSDASVLFLSSGDAPALVPAGREALYVAAGLGLRRKSPSGLIVPVDFAAAPGHYSRDVAWAAKTVVVAADRYVLLTPNQMGVNVDGVGLYLAAQQALDLSLAATWDTTTGTDYTIAINRAGRDFYVYCCLVGGILLKLVVSANSTYPSGFSASTSRKTAGFHCLCASVGEIAGHPASGYVVGDIIPVSVWDLKHRPACAPEGTRPGPGGIN